MKAKPTITYTQNNQEQTIESPFQSKLLEKDFMGMSDAGNIFSIDKKIELVHLKNFNFTKNYGYYFQCENDNTIVILENCTFTCKKLKIEGGHYQMINPIFDPKRKTEVSATHCKDVDINGNKDTKIHSLKTTEVANLSLRFIGEIQKLDLDCSNVIIQNVNRIFQYLIINSNLLIENCESDLFPDDYDNCFLYINCLKLKNSNIKTYQDNEYIISIELEDSSIDFASPILRKEFPILGKIKLVNSSITSEGSIIFPEHLIQINLDDTSFIKVGKMIKIGSHEFKKEQNPDEPFILCNKFVEEPFFVRNQLITALKEIGKQYQEKLHKISTEEEKKQLQILGNYIQTEKVNIKKRVKQQEQTNLTQIKLKDFNN